MIDYYYYDRPHVKSFRLSAQGPVIALSCPPSARPTEVMQDTCLLCFAQLEQINQFSKTVAKSGKIVQTTSTSNRSCCLRLLCESIQKERLDAGVLKEPCRETVRMMA